MKRMIIGGLMFAVMLPAVCRAEGSTDVAAVITRIQGKLSVAKSGTDTWIFAKEGDFLYEGDQLKTDSRSMASLTFVNGIEVKVNKDTQFAIRGTELSDKGKGNTVKLSVGQVWTRILKEGTKFDIETPAATVAIRGSAGDTKVRPNGWTQFDLYYGTAFVENEYGRVEMKPGSRTTCGMGSAPEEPRPLSEGEQGSWQETMAGKPQILVDLEKQETVVGFPVKVNVKALDANGKYDATAAVPVRIGSSNGSISFSQSRKGTDRTKIMTVNLRRGKAALWAFPQQEGSAVVTVQATGYDTGMGRLVSFLPAKKNLELELEMPDGKRKKIELRFRR